MSVEEEACEDGKMNAYKKEVVEWNMDRNGLVFDRELEEGMLVEELNEFMVATDLADHLDAQADFRFVLEGTTCKFLSAGVPSEDSMEWWIRLKNWSTGCLEFMDQIVRDHLENTFPTLDSEDVDSMIGEVFGIVCDANQKKPITSPDYKGKIPKGTSWVDPKCAILDCIKWYTVDQLKSKSH